MSVSLHYVGETRVYHEVVLDNDGNPIQPSSVAAKLVNRATGVDVGSLTVVYEAGLVKTTVDDTDITTAGNYQIEWDISYTEDGMSALKTIITEIEAYLRDTTYLMKLAKRARLLGGDNPHDLTLRMLSDDEWKELMVEAVRQFMTDYTIAENASGQDYISPEPTAGSDDEKLIVLWTAYLHYIINSSAIASERTRLFQVSYDSAYSLLKDRIDFLKEQINSLDSEAAMQFLSETEIEEWGQVLERMNDAISTWDT